MIAALALGFAAAKVVRIIGGNAPSAFGLTTHHVILFVMTGIVGPVAEELLDRGIYLSTLLGRLPTFPALLIVCLAEAVNHRAFVPALIIQVTISTAYILSRRSLSASVACHITVNILAFFPRVLLVR